MKPTLSRVLPFALFMAFIGVEELLRSAESHGLINLSSQFNLFLYPFKVISVGALLIYYRREYNEIKWEIIKSFTSLLLSAGIGLLVFILWINMDWSWATVGKSAGYNPFTMSENFTRIILIFFRLAGASLLVPVMEELFWRSWLLRYLIDQDFTKVEIGQFTWPSFIIGSVLFGIEHNLVAAGIMAGAVYSILLYRTKSLVHCIIAHSITNLALGVYVLHSGRWAFW